MCRRLTQSVLPLLLAGLCVASCGHDTRPPGNQPPTLSGTSAQATDVDSGASVGLTVEATDPEGDALTYTWTQNPPSPAGTFIDRNAASVTWKAPEVTEDTSFLLGATVSDGKGGVAHQSVQVTVHPAANHAPVLATGSPTASASSVVGAVPVQLSASATDPDGDALGYAWSQEPALARRHLQQRHRGQPHLDPARGERPPELHAHGDGVRSQGRLRAGHGERDRGTSRGPEHAAVADRSPFGCLGAHHQLAAVRHPLGQRFGLWTGTRSPISGHRRRPPLPQAPSTAPPSPTPRGPRRR